MKDSRKKSKSGFVYFARTSCGLIKIGRSKHPEKRIYSLNFIYPGFAPFENLGTVHSNNSQWLESLLHLLLIEFHVDEELFRLSADNSIVQYFLGRKFYESRLIRNPLLVRRNFMRTQVEPANKGPVFYGRFPQQPGPKPKEDDAKSRIGKVGS